MRDLPPQGSIGDTFLPRLVATLHLQEFEGTLRLSFPDATKVIYYKRGEVASAASNAEPDRLANILIREGRLSVEQFEMARSRLQPGASLGKTLIEMGFLSPSELLQGARRQVRIIVGSCFSAVEGAYEMVPGPLPPEVTSLGLNTKRLVFDCLMEAGDRAAVIREIGSMESVYRPTDQLASVLGSLRLDFETDRIGRMLDGSATLRDISGRTSHDDFTVGKMILALDLLGAAEHAAPVPVAVAAPERGHAIPISFEAPGTPADSPPVDDPGSAEDVVTIIDEPPDAPAGMPPAEVTAAPAADTAPDVAPPAFSTVGLTPPPPDAAAVEPPPVPAEDLPAFARPPGEETPVDEPQWQLDPQTGERVHVGPIEMTFDGQVADPAREPRGLTRFLIAAGAAAFVVAAAFGYVVLRRGPAERVSNAATPPAMAEQRPASNAGAGTPPPIESRREAAPLPVPSLAAAPPPAPSARSERVTAAAQAPVAAPRPSAPVRERPAVAPVTAGAAGLSEDPAYAAALERLDGGDPAGAAHLFREMLRSRDPRGATLQLLIACQEDTVKGARSRAGAHGSLIVLPYDLKGRACYRVCWGVYDGGEAARAAMADVPAEVTGGSVPIVVPLARLRAAE